MNACVLIAATDKGSPVVLYVGRNVDEAKAILAEGTLPGVLRDKGFAGVVKVELWRKPIPFKRRVVTVETAAKAAKQSAADGDVRGPKSKSK